MSRLRICRMKCGASCFSMWCQSALIKLPNPGRQRKSEDNPALSFAFRYRRPRQYECKVNTLACSESCASRSFLRLLMKVKTRRLSWSPLATSNSCLKRVVLPVPGPATTNFLRLGELRTHSIAVRNSTSSLLIPVQFVTECYCPSGGPARRMYMVDSSPKAFGVLAV